MTTNELLPCPFCNAAPEIIVGFAPLNSTFVDCKCGCTSPLFEASGEAVAWWNRRAASPAAPQVSDDYARSDPYMRLFGLSSVAPSPQPEQTAAQESAGWRAFIEECANRHGLMVNGNRLSIQAKQLLDAAPAPLSLPAEYASAALKLKEIGYAWVQTDHGMQWVKP